VSFIGCHSMRAAAVHLLSRESLYQRAQGQRKRAFLRGTGGGSWSPQADETRPSDPWPRRWVNASCKVIRVIASRSDQLTGHVVICTSIRRPGDRLPDCPIRFQLDSLFETAAALRAAGGVTA
jgi:hypothetical protein